MLFRLAVTETLVRGFLLWANVNSQNDQQFDRIFVQNANRMKNRLGTPAAESLKKKRALKTPIIFYLMLKPQTKKKRKSIPKISIFVSSPLCWIDWALCPINIHFAL